MPLSRGDWGQPATVLRVWCWRAGVVRYSRERSRSPATIVHTKDGRIERVATWNGIPGGSMKVSGATAAWKQDIKSVEVTNRAGKPVAQLSL
jgi:hypothetical protein